MTSAPRAKIAARAWFAVTILMVVYALAWMDRSLPSILIEPIKHAFRLSDTQLALMTGFAFSLCNATLTLPLSWVADRYDRSRLITVGVIIWSLMTFACSYATGIGTLFVFRLGVGLGEAVLVPSAYALIADYFPREARPKALMVFVFGSPIGSALALYVGGGLQGWLPQEALHFLRVDAPWRATFAIVGLSGLAVAALTFFLPEPRRGTNAIPAAEAAARAKARSGLFLRYLRQASFFLVPLLCGVTLYNALAMGYTAWLPPLFARRFGWSPELIGSRLGAAVLIIGLVGGPLGAWVAITMAKRRKIDSVVRVLLLSALFGVPLAALAPLLSSGVAAFAVFCASLLFLTAASTIAPAALLNGAPSFMRARVSAFYLFIANLVGGGGGPLLYALATDYLLHDPARIYISMALVTGLLCVGIVGFLFIADRQYARILKFAAEYEEAHVALGAGSS